MPNQPIFASLPTACADGLYRGRYPLGSAAAPTFSPNPGPYTSTQTVSLSCASPNATIFYTTDGSTPTQQSAVYNPSQPLNVTVSQTIQAIAITPARFQSSVSSAQYLINLTAATPTFSLAGGSYTSAQTVALSSTTPGAVIHYTLDGSQPTASSPTYSSPLTISVSTTLNAIAMAGGYINSAVATAVYIIAAQGATQVFSFTGFNGAPVQTAASTTVSGTSPFPLILNPATQHTAGAGWYTTALPVGSWTSDFSFTAGNGFGLGFCIQNSNSTTNPPAFGIHASADANGLGYSSYYQQPTVVNQFAIANSIALMFDQSGINQSSYFGTTQPNAWGLYSQGGPFMGIASGSANPPAPLDNGFVPCEDLAPYGINLWSGHKMNVHNVYDGTKLTSVMTDTVTGAQVRKIWEVDIAKAVGGTTAIFGFVGGTQTSGTILAQLINSWTHSNGFATKLVAPTISPAAGRYTSAQTCTLTAAAGATIYYTVNGQLPTTNSTKYTAPFTVSADQIVTAIAVQAGFTDSDPASSYFQIAATAVPTINLGSGFGSAGGLIQTNGIAKLTAGVLQLTDASSALGQTGSGWFVTPVSIATFDTTFVLNINGSAQGMTFTMQNQVPSASQVSGSQYNNATTLALSGGINALGLSASGLGYQGFYTGCCIKFDRFGSNTTGFYQGNVQPGGQGGTPLSPVVLGSHNNLTVRLQYDGTTLTQTVTDSIGNRFTKTYAVNIPAIVGKSTAYVGFTGGGGGGAFNIQQVLTWTW